MRSLDTFHHALSRGDRRLVESMARPADVQAALDEIPYSAEDRYRSPLSVMRDRRAHCFDGALFAAAALRRLGYPPLIVNLFAERDDEHLIAIYKHGGGFGAVAKSNFVGLRFREPVYRGLRELVMSYFEPYYNVQGEKTLRSYTRPLNLTGFDRLDWMTCDNALDAIAERLDSLQRIPLLTPSMVAALSRVDGRSYRAGLLGVNEAGLYRP